MSAIEDEVRAAAVREAAAYLERIHKRGLRSRDSILADLDSVAFRMEKGMTARGNTRTASRPVTAQPNEREALVDAVWRALEPRLEDVIDLDLNDPDDTITMRELVSQVADAVRSSGFRLSPAARTQPEAAGMPGNLAKELHGWGFGAREGEFRLSDSGDTLTWIDDEGGEYTVARSDYDAHELGGDPRPLLATVLDVLQWAAARAALEAAVSVPTTPSHPDGSAT